MDFFSIGTLLLTLLIFDIVAIYHFEEAQKYWAIGFGILLILFIIWVHRILVAIFIVVGIAVYIVYIKTNVSQEEFERKKETLEPRELLNAVKKEIHEVTDGFTDITFMLQKQYGAKFPPAGTPNPTVALINSAEKKLNVKFNKGEVQVIMTALHKLRILRNICAHPDQWADKNIDTKEKIMEIHKKFLDQQKSLFNVLKRKRQSELIYR